MALHSLDLSSKNQLIATQHISNIASAVFELVANSLDAQATQIQVMFHNKGFDSIVISDNGIGILPQDFKHVCQLSFTSKNNTPAKSNSSQLSKNLKTRGFKGRALASLCILSKSVIIITQSNNQDTGMKLEFDSTGTLIHSTPCARTTGTTVKIINLFEKYPVRRKFLKQSLSVNFSAAIELAQECALANRHCSFLVQNTSKSVQTLFRTTKVLNFPFSYEKHPPDTSYSLLSTMKQIFPTLVESQQILHHWSFSVDLPVQFSLSGVFSAYRQPHAKKKLALTFCNGRIFPFPELQSKLLSVYRLYNPAKGSSGVYRPHDPCIFTFELFLPPSTIDPLVLNQRILHSRSNRTKQYGNLLKFQKEFLSIVEKRFSEFLRQTLKTSKSLEGEAGSKESPVLISSVFPVVEKKSSELSPLLSASLSSQPVKTRFSISMSKNPQAIHDPIPLIISLSSMNQRRILESLVSVQTFDETSSDNDCNSLGNSTENSTENSFTNSSNYFQQFQLIGQFNNGFIVGTIQGKLFIFDQHACDEISNYEKLIGEYIENGGRFTPTAKIGRVGSVGSATSTTSTPILKTRERDGSTFVPQSIKNQLANKACRSSIMIGDPLEANKMLQVVHRLSNLSAPWHCPHGRPTSVDLSELNFDAKNTPYSKFQHDSTVIGETFKTCFQTPISSISPLLSDRISGLSEIDHIFTMP